MEEALILRNIKAKAVPIPIARPIKCIIKAKSLIVLAL